MKKRKKSTEQVRFLPFFLFHQRKSSFSFLTEQAFLIASDAAATIAAFTCGRTGDILLRSAYRKYIFCCRLLSDYLC